MSAEQTKQVWTAEGLTFDDPSELIEGDPVSLITDHQIFQRIVENFDPRLFDPVQKLRVETFSSTGELAIREFVLDGRHRTKAADKLKGKSLTHLPGFVIETIPTRDVTVSYLKKPWVVPEDERVPGTAALTMIQYLRAIIPSTIAHQEIAPDRVAAHLINAWNNLVGKNLADKFSALAALNFLRNPDVPIGDTKILLEFFANQGSILVGTTNEEENLLVNALTQVGKLIQEAELNKEEVAEAAFSLVGIESSAIGGERQARSEVYGLLYGLLYRPKVEQALRHTFPNSLAELEQRRTQLGELLFEVLGKTEKKVGISTLVVALTSPYLTVGQISNILQAKQPASSYRELNVRANTNRLMEDFMDKHDINEIPDIEGALIKNLGDSYQQKNSREYVKVIEKAGAAIRSARFFKLYLEEIWIDSTRIGVPESDLELIKKRIANVQRPILASSTLENVFRYTETLEKTISEVKTEIAKKRTYQKVFNLISGIFGDKDQVGEIIDYVIRETNAYEGFSKSWIESEVRKLSALTNESLIKTIRGGTGNIRPIKSRSQPRKLNLWKKPEIYENKIRPIAGKQSKTRGVEKKLDDQSKRDALNDKLINILASLNYNFDDTEVSLGDLRQETIDWFDRVLVKLGKLRFDHPNIVEILENYLVQSEGNSGEDSK